MKFGIIYTILALLFLTSTPLKAQTVHLEEHQLAPILNPWLLTNNAAGLGLSTVSVHGVTQLGYHVSTGDLHRAQEGNGISGLNFYSERYDNISKNWTVWGSFNFDMNREKNRAWSDVINTYNNNPYIYGSSVKGDYDKQMFDFKVNLSSRPVGRMTYGVGVDYKVGDFSRLRDPRTRVFLADYAILPGVTVQLNEKNYLGINLSARYEKEKTQGITTVQNDPNLKYYTFFGIENANAIIGGYKGFQRQFVSMYYAGDIQYQLKTAKTQFLLSAGARYQMQDILEDIKQTPGTFESLTFNANAALTSKLGNLLLNVQASATMKQGSADENIQELISINNPVTGVNSKEWVTLFTYDNQYLNNTYESSLKIDLRDINAAQNDYSWLIGLQAGANGFDNTYQLPFSNMQANRANAGVYGHVRLLNINSHRIVFDVNALYDTKIHSNLTLQDGATDAPMIDASTYKNGTFDVVNNVIIPDFAYYNADMMKFKVESTYSFPLNFKKLKMIGFAKAQFHHASNKNLGSWSGGQVSIGIIP